MIKHIVIENFKCFDNEALDFKPLTILTGTNSSGKSSLIQAILKSGQHASVSDIADYLSSLGDFDDLKNKYKNPREYKITITFKDDATSELLSDKKSTDLQCDQNKYLKYPENLTYLNANRSSIKEINKASSELRYFGIYGDNTANFYEINKSNPIEKSLIKDLKDLDTPHTLEGQVDYWMKAISDQVINLKTEKITSTLIKAFYEIEGLSYKPNNIGAGISYIASILISCLSAKPKNIIIIENPEIHLHPKAQAKIGEFLAFVASKGIQVILETHNDHLINRIRYEVFKKSLSHEDVIIHYKDKNMPFRKIEISEKGLFSNNGENTFPEGFYDATLEEIYEINIGN